MPRSSVLIALSFVLFVSFVFFSYLVHENVFTQLDFDTTVKLQDNIPHRFDNIFSYFSAFGSFEFFLVFLGLLFLALRKFVAGIVTLTMFVGFHIIELYGKFYVDHPPPPEFMLRTQYPIDFPQFHVRAEFSYPSGHSGRTVFLASILVCIILASGFSKPVKYALIGFIAGFTFVMLLSRPYLGEHWTTDVIGGALLGASLGIFAAVFLDKKYSFKNALKFIGISDKPKN